MRTPQIRFSGRVYSHSFEILRRSLEISEISSLHLFRPRGSNLEMRALRI